MTKVAHGDLFPRREPKITALLGFPLTFEDIERPTNCVLVHSDCTCDLPGSASALGPRQPLNKRPSHAPAFGALIPTGPSIEFFLHLADRALPAMMLGRGQISSA